MTRLDNVSRGLTAEQAEMVEAASMALVQEGHLSQECLPNGTSGAVTSASSDTIQPLAAGSEDTRQRTEHFEG